MSEQKNIWVAASDGDLERVKELVESGTSPNQRDANTYTPIHAAVSWGHGAVLRYLLSKGGDINITDEDGETPLFTVDSQEMAELVLELGADAMHRNNEGRTAADIVQEEHPLIAAYLRERTGQAAPVNGATVNGAAVNGAHGVNGIADGAPMSDDDDPAEVVPSEPERRLLGWADIPDLLSSGLIGRAQMLMMQAEAEGKVDDPETEERLRVIVTEAVDRSLAMGRARAEREAAQQGQPEPTVEDDPSKRTRLD